MPGQQRIALWAVDGTLPAGIVGPAGKGSQSLLQMVDRCLRSSAEHCMLLALGCLGSAARSVMGCCPLLAVPFIAPSAIPCHTVAAYHASSPSCSFPRVSALLPFWPPVLLLLLSPSFASLPIPQLLCLPLLALLPRSVQHCFSEHCILPRRHFIPAVRCPMRL